MVRVSRTIIRSQRTTSRASAQDVRKQREAKMGLPQGGPVSGAACASASVAGSRGWVGVLPRYLLGMMKPCGKQGLDTGAWMSCYLIVVFLKVGAFQCCGDGQFASIRGACAAHCHAAGERLLREFSGICIPVEQACCDTCAAGCTNVSQTKDKLALQLAHAAGVRTGTRELGVRCARNGLRKGVNMTRGERLALERSVSQ